MHFQGDAAALHVSSVHTAYCCRNEVLQAPRRLRRQCASYACFHATTVSWPLRCLHSVDHRKTKFKCTLEVLISDVGQIFLPRTARFSHEPTTELLVQSMFWLQSSESFGYAANMGFQVQSCLVWGQPEDTSLRSVMPQPLPIEA